MYKQTNKFSRNCCGFTLIEAIAALAIVGFVCGTVVLVINNSLDAMTDYQSRLRAIDAARENIELILSNETLPEFSESGISELYPDIEWTRGVEVATFPASGKFWLRAFSSANFYNTDGELEEIEFENWLTPLSPQQERLVREDRQKEQEYLYELQEAELQEQAEEQALEQEQSDSEQLPEQGGDSEMPTLEDALKMLEGGGR